MTQDTTTAVTHEERKPDIRTLSNKELKTYIQSLGEKPFRAIQISEWLWQKNAFSFDEMTNLSKALRSRIQEDFALYGPMKAVKQVSEDGSRKYLLTLEDGVSVECVGMPTKNKLAVCVSTQAGCGMGCAFCATGKAGLTRSLKYHEIVEQVQFVARDFGKDVSSVVFMGQGEPFANYDEVMKALRCLNSEKGLNIGARHLTVSTCGVIPGITRFSKEPEQFTLAISLHSAVQSTRNDLMPGVKKWSLMHLHEAMKAYSDRTGRRPTYEYAMIKGVNDSEAELDALCQFCKKTLCHVNLIPLNHVPGFKFEPSSAARIGEFQRKLEKYGVETSIRNSRGRDIAAACGQLKQLTDR